MIYGYKIAVDSSVKYVGITTDVQRRLREHRSKGPLARLDFKLVEVLEFNNRKEASEWEISCIESYGIENILNTSLGGFGGRKRVCSEREKSLLSSKAKNRYKSEEYRVVMGFAVREAYKDPEKRARLAAAVRKSCASPETKAKRSDAQTASWSDPEIRSKRLQGLRDSRNDPAKAEQRSIAAKKAWETRRQKA